MSKVWRWVAIAFSVLMIGGDGGILLRRTYPAGIFFRCVAAMDGLVWVSAADTAAGVCRLLILDGETLEERAAAQLGPCDPAHPMDAAPCAMVPWKGTMAVFLPEEVRFYRPDGSLAAGCKVPGKAGSAAVGADGKLWFSIGPELWVLDEFPA